jgi:hypothetical protein
MASIACLTGAALYWKAISAQWPRASASLSKRRTLRQRAKPAELTATVSELSEKFTLIAP